MSVYPRVYIYVTVPRYTANIAGDYVGNLALILLVASYPTVSTVFNLVAVDSGYRGIGKVPK